MATMTQAQVIRTLAELTNFRGDDGLRDAVLESLDEADRADEAAANTVEGGSSTAFADQLAADQLAADQAAADEAAAAGEPTPARRRAAAAEL